MRFYFVSFGKDVGAGMPDSDKERVKEHVKRFEHIGAKVYSFEAELLEE